MTHLRNAACELAAAVDGVDWDAGRVQRAVDAIRRHGKCASQGELDRALAVLSKRLERFRIDDADGIAHVAVTGGSLVEFGATAAPLAEILLRVLPEVLRAARQYADRCLVDFRVSNQNLDDDSGIVAKIDQRSISRLVFRDYLAVDRPGGVALAHLEHWTLAAVAAWTRTRDCLVRATNDQELLSLVEQLGDSEAHWLRTLLGVQLDTTWLVLCPLQSRGFQVLVDGVVANQDLHALLASALESRGVHGKASSEEVISYLEGHDATRPKRQFVSGTWELYDYRAATYDLNDGKCIPQQYRVFAEGLPRDIPPLAGKRTLVIGSAVNDEKWELVRIFPTLPCQITVEDELSVNAFQNELDRVQEAGR